LFLSPTFISLVRSLLHLRFVWEFSSFAVWSHSQPPFHTSADSQRPRHFSPDPVGCFFNTLIRIFCFSFFLLPIRWGLDFRSMYRIGLFFRDPNCELSVAHFGGLVRAKLHRWGPLLSKLILRLVLGFADHPLPHGPPRCYLSPPHTQKPPTPPEENTSPPLKFMSAAKPPCPTPTLGWVRQPYFFP